VSDEGSSGSGLFLTEFGEGTTLLPDDTVVPGGAPILFRISDASGTATFEQVTPPAFSTLSSSDAFLLDDSMNSSAVFVWIGNSASLNEKRLAPQYAQRYLYEKQSKDSKVKVAVPIIRIREGNEPREFLKALGA
jgi:gelsolin